MNYAYYMISLDRSIVIKSILNIAPHDCLQTKTYLHFLNLKLLGEDIGLNYTHHVIIKRWKERK